jgi:hypothetical protein
MRAVPRLHKESVQFVWEPLPMDCYLDVVGGLVPLRSEEGGQKGVWDKVADKGQQQNYWTGAVQETNTDDRPDLPSEGAPDIDKTVINIFDTKTHWPTDPLSQRDSDSVWELELA